MSIGSREELLSFRNELVGLRGNHKSRKKVTNVFYELEEEGFVEQSETESLIHERLFDQNAPTWLSLNCHSPFLTSNDQQLHRVLDFNWWDLSLYSQFVSALSLFSSSRVSLEGISFFDGSRINPIEEAALVLNNSLANTEKFCEENLQAEVLAWLHDSLKYDTKDSPVTSYESSDSSYERSLCEDSSVFESSWTSLSTHEDSSSSQLSDFDRTCFWVSLLDLEGEDFERLYDKDQEFEVSQSDPPSPSSHIKRKFEIGSFNSAVTSLGDEKSNTDLLSELVLESENQFIYSTCEGDLEDLSSNEPLFWPFESMSYWRPEIDWNGRCTSPIEKSTKISGSERSCAARSIRLSLPDRKVAAITRRDVPYGHTRKIVFRSGSMTSCVLGCKTRDGNNGTRGINMCPSRVGSCTQGAFELLSRNLSMKRNLKKLPKRKDDLPLIHHGKGRSFHLQRQQCQDDLQFLWEKNQQSKNNIKKAVIIEHNDLQEMNKQDREIPCRDYNDFLLDGFKFNEEVPIETLVGLNEFNGHEGIDVEFDEGQFSLDGLLS